MSAGGLARLGVRCADASTGMATLGVFCGSLDSLDLPAPIPIPGTGGGTRRRSGYDRHREHDLEQTRRRKILQEDDEIAALIAAMVTRDLI